MITPSGLGMDTHTISLGAGRELLEEEGLLVLPAHVRFTSTCTAHSLCHLPLATVYDCTQC
jgi:hypothetical protein